MKYFALNIQYSRNGISKISFLEVLAQKFYQNEACRSIEEMNKQSISYLCSIWKHYC
jgi:hypothetical protein